MADRVEISRKAARRLALRGQLLAGKPNAGKSATATLANVEHLGYVQIDSIAVVQRAHHHVLWTRQPAYDPTMLDVLLSRDRSVFEYWTHAASYVPMRDYRFYRRRMDRIRDSEGAKQWRSANRKVVEHVLDRIRAEGALPSSAFADERKKRGTWWDWKPAKRALELLLDAGELMVAERRNFQRVYDLSERVMPAGVSTDAPSDTEQTRFLIRRGLNLYGVLGERELWFRRGDRNQIGEVLNQMLEADDVVR